MSRYIDLSKVEILFQGESMSIGTASTAERRYMIKIDKSAFTNEITNKSVLRIEHNVNNITIRLSPIEMFYLAGLAKSIQDSIQSSNYNIFKTIPYSRFYYSGLSQSLYDGSIFNLAYSYCGFIGTPYSLNRMDLRCSNVDVRFIDEVCILTLGYSFFGMVPSNKFATFIMPYGNAQRYPSVYRFKADGGVELNTVTYSGDTQVAELPETYGSECRYRVLVINPVYPAYYQSFLGTVNNAPINWLDVGAIIGEPAEQAAGLMIDNYNVSVIPTVYPVYTGLWPPTSTTLTFQPSYLFLHELGVVGYRNNSLSADAGFRRPVVYVNPETGKPPEDITVGNGIEQALIAKPADWSFLAQ